MCRCVNGRCRGDDCQCRKQNKKCVYCWCVLCTNRDESAEIVQQVYEVEQIQYSPTRSYTKTSAVSSPTVVGGDRLAMTTPKKKHCKCKSSKCGTGQCGCRKSGEFCGRGCECPSDCKNQSSATSSASQPNQPSSSEFQIPSTVPPTIYSTPTRNPPLPTNTFPPIPRPPVVAPTRPNITHIKTEYGVNQIVEDISQIGLAEGQISQHSSIEQIMELKLKLSEQTKNNLSSASESSQTTVYIEKCCYCEQCDITCPCFKGGDCCFNCHKGCLNKELKLDQVNIPNYIKI